VANPQEAKVFCFFFSKKKSFLSSSGVSRNMPDAFQSPPQHRNRFLTDPALRHGLERILPQEVFANVSPQFERFGERCARELPALAERAERGPPRLVPFDAWGNRIDRIEVDPAWLRLVEIGQEEGLVAVAYEGAFGPHARVVQAGLANLYDPVSAVATCPLVMTDGAAWLLRTHDRALWERYGARLTARTGAITSGQWMTEAAGGSDVSQAATRAVPDANGAFRLHGLKWFTSATTSDLAMVLARPEGAEEGAAGLSLFLLELRDSSGAWNGVRVRRLKEKMGTHALPTAEMELCGALAVPVGGLGRGVAKVASMLNIARVWAAYAGPAAVGHLLGLARDYAFRREAFGGPLARLPIHGAWLARIAAEYEAMLGMCFATAEALGRAEHGNDGLARLLAPLLKFSCARGGINGASELIESFGGAGYVEDTGMPAVFRNAHVHAIWEGTGSVLAHDVLRALKARALAESWLEDVSRRLREVTHPALDAVTIRIAAALEVLRPMVLAPDEREGRRLAAGMARVTQAAVLAEAAAWRLATKGDRSALVAAEIITREPMVQAPLADLDFHCLAFAGHAEAER
jgi:alkylation response protein AidB-like acyl-CoA dehydrogenase